MAEPRKLTPAEEARLAQVREQFKQKQAISNSLNSIKYRIGVYSGKGGVGKTTVTTNLALMLAKSGKKVAILDCDIDCPNVTRVLKISNRPEADNEGKMIPPEKYGVSVMSMGFFQENEDEAIVWRGPMIHNAINQFISKTNWGDIDYLICDLPPGTSDAPLTVMQTLNLDGFIIVSTPQELAALDAKRSINMIKKLNLKVFGVVENMSGGIFGKGGASMMADELGRAFDDLLGLEQVVVFIDEVDDIASSRAARPETQAVVNELLKAIVRVREVPGRLLVCATNSIAALDPAVVRPGRFDLVIPIGPPDPDARLALLTEMLGVIPGSAIDPEAMVEPTDGLTPADIESAIQRAAASAFRSVRQGDTTATITNSDLIEAIDSTVPTISEANRAAFVEESERFSRL